MSLENDEKQPNWVLWAMVVVSLGIHLVIFVRIADLYDSDTRRVIELTVREENPWQRSIPQPRMHRKAPEVNEVSKIDAAKPEVPDIKMDPVDADVPDTISEEISAPDTTGLSADVADWQPDAGGAGRYVTRKDYFEMLRLKIESSKEYPESARRKQLQGRVVVGFTLDPDGTLSSAEIVESSRHPELDRAALKAVKQAAPFPRPPGRLFDGPLRMNIPVLFELR
ncbi:MAG: energy transducer TonB [Desulfobacterales bacterium]|nr:energy transducer TonB [Desulfobacterales bacterium]MBS3756207.1 energy transducer TonB [Desulfobacterales bacterium]